MDTSYYLWTRCLFAGWIFLPVCGLSLCCHMFWLTPLKVLGLALVKVVCSVWIQASVSICQHTQNGPITQSARPLRDTTHWVLQPLKTRTTALCTDGSRSRSICREKSLHLFCSPSYLFYLSSNILFISVCNEIGIQSAPLSRPHSFALALSIKRQKGEVIDSSLSLARQAKTFNLIEESKQTPSLSLTKRHTIF